MAKATLVLFVVLVAITSMVLVFLVIKWGSKLVRQIAAVLLMAPVLFCVYGFLASMEPGVHLAWRIGYSVLGLLFFGGALWVGSSARKGSKVRDRRTAELEEVER